MHDDNFLRPLSLDVLANEVHIWRVWLPDWSGARVARLLELLTVEERARANRYLFDRDKRRAAVSRGLLRVLCGQYCSLPPTDFAFITNDYGKPMLDKTFAATDLHFNLSHSENALVFAFTLQGEVGVDVEEIRNLPDLNQLAGSFLTKQEADYLQELPLDQRTTAFFDFWTAKEAYLKATGRGLSGSLDAVEFGKIVHPPLEKNPRWSILALPEPYPNYKSAIVIENKLPVQNWQTVTPPLFDSWLSE